MGELWRIRYGTGSGIGSSSYDRYDRNEAYFRIVAELKKLTNEKGLTMDGSKCDPFGQCAPVFRMYLDTKRLNADFPGARDSKYYTEVDHVDDNNSPDVRNGTVTRDVCAVPYKNAVLRVLVEDRDGFNSNVVINNFDCKIESKPERSETYVLWQDGACTKSKQSDKMKLTFRYKVTLFPAAAVIPIPEPLVVHHETPLLDHITMPNLLYNFFRSL